MPSTSIFAVSQLFSFPLAMHKVVKKEKGGIFLFKDRKKKMEFLADYLELPKDLMLDLPRSPCWESTIDYRNHRELLNTQRKDSHQYQPRELLIDGKAWFCAIFSR